MESHWLNTYQVPKRLKATAQSVAAMAVSISDPLEMMVVRKPREVRLAGEWIEWKAAVPYQEGDPITLERFDSMRWGEAEYSDRILWDFVALAEQDDPAAFLGFAQRYGVLVALQTERRWRICTDDESLLPLQVEGREGWYREAIATWRAVAWHLKMILVLGSYLKNRQIVPGVIWTAGEALLQTDDTWFHDRWRAATPEAFEQIFQRPLSEMPPLALQILYGDQASHVSERVSALLSAATLVPTTHWFYDRDYAQLMLGPDIHSNLCGHTGAVGWTLFPILVTQLAAALGPDVLLTRCSRCTTAYIPNRKPRTDQPHYCLRCKLLVRRATVRTGVAKGRAAKKAAAPVRPDNPGDNQDEQ